MTASAALDSGKYTATSTFVRPRLLHGLRQAREQLRHEQPVRQPSRSQTALQYSVNSVFCNIGLALGAKRIVKQAKAFGFYERPPLETPDSERLPSGLYKGLAVRSEARP